MPDQLVEILDDLNSLSLSEANPLPNITFVPNATTPTLPYELVEKIITIAWREHDWFSGLTEQQKMERIEDFDCSRWGLFRTLALVCHQWRTITHDVKFQYIILETDQDFQIYHKLVGQQLSSYYSDEEYNFALFNRCHLRVVLSSWTASVVYGDCTSGPSVINLLPNISSLEIFILHYHGEQTRCAWKILSHCTPTSRIVISWKTSLFVPHKRFTKSINFPITHLHILQHPENIVIDFLAFFPNLTHLYLSNHLSIAHLAEKVPNLEVLTLDVNDSVADWTIVEALDLGFMRRMNPSAGQNKIRINARVEEPSGWRDLCDACIAHGVTLELKRMFTGVTEIEEFSRLPLWY